MNVVIPNILNTLNAVNLVNYLIKHSAKESNFILDFSHVTFVQPFSMVYLASSINYIKSNLLKNIDCINIDNDSCSYMHHMGFFHTIGIVSSIEHPAISNSNYIPISKIDYSEAITKIALGGMHAGEYVDDIARDLSHVLVQAREGNLYETLSYSIREVLRNTLEHAYCKNIYYAAQYWPSLNKVEIVVADDGIGLQKSLSYNPYFKELANKTAVKYSLMPGISGKVYEGAKLKDHEWENSGYGLYMVNRLCRNGGQFFICSFEDGIYMEGNKRNYTHTNFKGTALKLVIELSNLQNIRESLMLFQQEGITFASKHSFANLTPSIASTMLTEDFREQIKPE